MADGPLWLPDWRLRPPGEAEKGRPAIFLIGDSFVEAIGMSYEKSFTGLMACDAARQGKAIWNLGVASCSPAIYHRKIRAAVEKLGIEPEEIHVFLDLSDSDDDANDYRVGQDGVITAPSFRLAYDLYLTRRLAR